ncbi:MAG: ATP-dependent helicase [Pseudonocardiales bacterium]|nr:MAG: ATP-dependent helicase [Pseudonocardiales bacterium]
MSAAERFSAATRAWLESAFAAPTPAQLGGWDAIGRGEHTLVIAPTGSGKTLAAFLAAIDRLATTPPPDDPLRRCRVLYVSPLKALAIDIERNLRAPLAGIRQQAMRSGLPVPDIAVSTRSGDTPPEERRTFARRPGDILITTPESLFLILTSGAREALRGVETVIVDEIHAVCSTKRGAHLALSLERLDALLGSPAQRIGLSATVRPAEEVARFLGGRSDVTVVAPPSAKTVELDVVVPVEDLAQMGEPTGELPANAAGAQRRSSIWPAVEERILDLIEAHRSTIVFANSRRLAERLTARLNELAYERAEGAPPESTVDGRMPAEMMAQAGSAAGAPAIVARAHHGSVSREQRAVVEEELKAGRLPAVVATSSLELGIDMGAVDLVVQVESPPSVASGLQRIGRAGHHVGVASHGAIFPKHRGDLVPCAVVAERMTAGQIEAIRYPRNALDVLAQQIVAMVAMEDWTVDDVADLVRRAAPFASLPASALESVLDMLSGRYPSDAFAELRPRLTWDRVTGGLRARPGAQRLAVTSGGTIPDRGMFGVFLLGETPVRVGELDEEMVYESRVGDVFLLGTSSWRIEDITHDRVLVSGAPGVPGKMPFWKGDAIGRPLELGRAIGAFVRELSTVDDAAARRRLAAAGLDPWAADNLLGYLAEQRAATGHLPDDRTIVVERFRDELGDWRVVIHSPFGAQVNSPWSLAIAARLRERFGLDVASMHADDGIVLRLPDTDAEPPDADVAVFDPDEVESIVTTAVSTSALFAARFRECAARALLMPRRGPGRRSPLWQQRQRSAQLLSVASDYGSFPVVLETMRECVQDVFDVPGLQSLMRDLQARRVRLVEVETQQGSPFAQSLLFGYVGMFLYDDDTPLAERRAQALSLDTTLLAELLGQAELRELLDPDAVGEVEAELQRLADDRRARDLESTADLLRLLGDLTTDEALARGATPAWLSELEASRRAIRVRIAGAERWIAIEDAGRVRDALGVALPVGVPGSFTEPVRDPLGDLLSRYTRTHGPFHAGDVALRFGLGPAVVVDLLNRLVAAGRLVGGEFRPGGSGHEWCDAEVLRRLRRRSLARLRGDAEPVSPSALGRFLPAWAQLVPPGRGAAALDRALEQLAGAVVPASALESLILPARVEGYSPALLDGLTAAGEISWCGAGGLSGGDGWICLAPADLAPALLPEPDPDVVATPLHEAVLTVLDGDTAMFFRALSDRVYAGGTLGSPDDTLLGAAVWDLVWGGWLSNDTLAPLRASVIGRAPVRRPPAARMRRPGRARLPTRAGPPTLAGRWSRVPDREADPTRRSHAVVEALLDRHGVLTRGAVAAERVPGGFAAVYRVLRAFEESGRVQRGYVVAGLGAAQFAVGGAINRLRGFAAEKRDRQPALVLATADPANPYGAALPWPDRAAVPGSATGHRPGRKSGALVVLVDGELALYVERGGRSLLSWSDDPAVLQAAADALSLAVREGRLGRLAVERADGAGVHESPLAAALEAAGFRPTPRGLRLRA